MSKYASSMTEALVYVNNDGPSYDGIFATAEEMFSLLQDILKEQSVLLMVVLKNFFSLNN